MRKLCNIAAHGEHAVGDDQGPGALRHLLKAPLKIRHIAVLIAEGLGITETISSPTYTIVKEYYSGRLPLYHFDVYRICDPEEFFNIGAEDYLNGEGVSIVEWADLVIEEIPEDALFIFIDYGQTEGERIYKCTF